MGGLGGWGCVFEAFVGCGGVGGGGGSAFRHFRMGAGLSSGLGTSELPTWV